MAGNSGDTAIVPDRRANEKGSRSTGVPLILKVQPRIPLHGMNAFCMMNVPNGSSRVLWHPPRPFPLLVHRMNRRLVMCIVAGVIAAGVAWQAALPDEPAAAPIPPTFAEPFARSPVGRAAPDFELKEIAGGQSLRLSSMRGRPTVLAFGSFSCDLFCAQLKKLTDLHAEFGTRANSLFVYIREANHDNPALDAHLRNAPRGADRVASGIALYKIGFPCVDGRESETVREYHGWPERLYLLNSDGVVTWESSIGIGTEGLRLNEAEAKLRSQIMARDRQ